MMSISSMSAGQGNYYADLAREDYYLEGGEPPGQWIGDGAKKLGLSGPIDRREFLELFGGHLNGKKLVQNAGKKNHRPGWDLSFSAPKTVSTAWSQASHETQIEIQASHRMAVERAIEYLEQSALWTRRGRGGTQLERCRGIVAAFEHGTSRAQDPQLHTHALLLNIGVREDGKTSSLETRPVYLAKMAAGALYRSELAYQLERRLGLFAVLRSKDTTFDIAGVSKTLADTFSTRRKEIESALAAKGLRSSRAAEIAALDTRGTKGHISREELFAQCRAVGKEQQWSTEELNLLMKGPQAERQHGDGLKKACALATQKITDHVAFFTERDLLRRVAEASQTLAVGAHAVRDSVTKYLSKNEQIVRIGHRHKEAVFTTKEMIGLENDLLRMAKEGSKRTWGRVTESNIEEVQQARPTMKPEQREALRHITQNTGSIASVTGMAGTGKTFMLGAVREALEKSGHRILGATLAGKAADGLQEGSGIKSSTIASLLIRLGNGRETLDAKTVLVLDEAGMVGTRQLHQIMAATEKAGSKLVLVGDEKQLQPIEAGGPFATISKEIGTINLTDIVRQDVKWQRQAVKDFAVGEATKGLQAYAERGFVSVSRDREEAREALINEWQVEGLKAPKENLIVAATNADATSINRSIQALRLQNEGDQDISKMVLGGEAFYSGDRIIFTRNSQAVGVKNGTFGTITSIDEKEVSVVLDNGDERRFSTNSYDHLKLGYAVTTHKGQGATVDNVFILTDEAMQDREITYVQASRSRKAAHFFTTEIEAGDKLKDLAAKMGRSHRKTMAIDFMASLHREERNGRNLRQESNRKDEGPILASQIDGTESREDRKRARAQSTLGEVADQDLVALQQMRQRNLQEKHQVQDQSQSHQQSHTQSY